MTAGDPGLEQLTDTEIARVIETQSNGRHEDLRRCALGILNTGANVDNTKEILGMYPDFDIEVEKSRQGVAFTLLNAPSDAFIEGTDDKPVLIESIREHICAAVRDLVHQINVIGRMETEEEITEAVFKIMRHAGFFDINAIRGCEKLDMNRIFAWGGHSINDEEYKYSKDVGEQMALRLFEIITGCGPGAMRGPFSGSTRANTKRRIVNAKMIGLTCPSIITSEPPNEFVNPLIIMPDIEKRLEGFVRGSMGGIVFPGGVGTAEEIQMILSILLHEKNNNVQYPLVFTGPRSAKSYFQSIDTFLMKTLGHEAIDGKYKIFIDDPKGVADYMKQYSKQARMWRDALNESYTWFGKLYLPPEVQHPFESNHENVAKLNLHRDQSPYELAVQLRRLFSAIVAGNVTDAGIHMIQEKGSFEINGDPEIIEALEELLQRFVQEKRMKLEGDYKPCYMLKK